MQGALLTDTVGSDVEPSPWAPKCRGQNFKKAVAEVARWNYFVFYVIVKIIIMPAQLSLDEEIFNTFQVITVCLYPHKGV